MNIYNNSWHENAGVPLLLAFVGREVLMLGDVKPIKENLPKLTKLQFQEHLVYVMGKA